LKLEDDKTFVSTVLGRVIKEDAGADILKDHGDNPAVTTIDYWPRLSSPKITRNGRASP
jgi:hypothetical protein